MLCQTCCEAVIMGIKLMTNQTKSFTNKMVQEMLFICVCMPLPLLLKFPFYTMNKTCQYTSMAYKTFNIQMSAVGRLSWKGLFKIIVPSLSFRIPYTNLFNVLNKLSSTSHYKMTKIGLPHQKSDRVTFPLTIF